MTISRRSFLFAAAGWPLAAAADPAHVHRRPGLAFGTQVRLTFVHADARAAAAALDASFAEIRAVERAASLFDPRSELARLNAQGVLERPSAALLDMMRAAQSMSQATGGAFDVTVQPLWRLCDRAARAGAWPSEAELARARALIGFTDVRISDERIAFARPGMQATLNGVAQGYAADRVAAAARGYGVADMFLDTGEIYAQGRRADRGDWAAGLADPRAAGDILGRVAPIAGCLSTSGDDGHPWSDDFSRHHIVDARSGVSQPDLAQASVIAPSGVAADAASTAILALGLAEGRALAARQGWPALLVRKDGEIVRTQDFPLHV